MKKRRIDIFDTTLRDGEQGPGCLVTLDSKLAIAEKLDSRSVLRVILNPYKKFPKL